MAQDENPRIITPPAILCFPVLETPEQINGQGEKLYSARLLFDVPNFSQKSAQMYRALKVAGFNALTEKFGSKAMKDPKKGIVAKGLRWPIVDAEEKEEYAGHTEGRFFLNVKTKRRPPLARAKRTPDGFKPVATDDLELFYPGAIVWAAVSPYAYDNVSKGVRFTLESLCFLKHGERLAGGGAGDAEADFEDASFDDFEDMIDDPEDDEETVDEFDGADGADGDDEDFDFD